MRSWEQLEQACRDCQRCALADTRTNVVFGVGPHDAEIMMVGEGPGEHEDEAGIPFVGKAGQLLDEMLSLVGLSREKNVYICNIVKCRPPKNRDPLNTERGCLHRLSPGTGSPAAAQNHRVPGSGGGQPSDS